MKWLSIILGVILIFIVIVANLGLGPSVFPFIYLIPGLDKAGHFILMGVLSFLINSVMSASRVNIFSVDFLKGSLVVIVIATIEEFSQLFLKFRAFSILDLFFGYSGIIIFGYFAAYLVNRKRRLEKLDPSD